MILNSKLFIEGHIKAKTGIAIGGDKSSVEIGGIDNNVIKDSRGVPFIPGSSLKGKLRSLIERAEGRFLLKLEDPKNNIKGVSSGDEEYNYDVKKFLKHHNPEEYSKVKGGPCSCGKCSACKIFGTGASVNSIQPVRLYVRDCMLNGETLAKMSKNEEPFSGLELDYTESKWENTIDRVTSNANPRNIERVPAGALFDFNMVYNLFESNGQEEDDIDILDVLFEGMNLLEDDYIGAHGSRGYGCIEFTNISISVRTLEDYKKNEGRRFIVEKKHSLNEIDFEDLKSQLRKITGLNVQDGVK